MSSCCDPVLTPGSPVELALLFTTGLTISLGHCIGMCGPIVSAYSVRQEDRGIRGWRRLPPLARYHAGRIVSYTIIGAAFALIGSATRITGTTATIQGGLALLVGLLMLLLGLGLLGLLPTQGWVEGVGFGRGIASRIRRLLSAETWPRQLGLGVANGFLPCGPVVAVALSAAATSKPTDGMLAMAIYGLGTVPALIVLGLGVGTLTPRVRQHLFRLGAVLVLLIGLQLCLRGLAAFNLLPHLRFGEVVIF
jgi:sulfite exporter TauE/SafE